MKNELKPWLEQEVPLELRRLLMAARTQEPTIGEVQRVMAQVAMARISNSSSASIELSAGNATGSAIVGMKWALLGAGLAGVMAVGVAVVDGPRLDAHSVASSGIGSAVLESPATVPAVGAKSVDPTVPRSPEVAPTAGARPEPASGHPWPRKVRTSPDLAFSGGASTRRAESGQSTQGSSRAAVVPVAAPVAAPPESQSDYIDRARDALKRGRPGDTLRILDQYKLAFQTRTFVPEALQLRMRAFASLGKGTAARQVGETLATRYPSTPQGREALEFLGR